MLTDNQIDLIIDTVSPHIRAWSAKGVPVVSPYGLLSNINFVRPTDGLVYLRKYLERPESSPVRSPKAAAEEKRSVVGLEEAFRRRFEEEWIQNRSARVVLLACMIESGSGENNNVDKYGQIVIKLTDDEIRQMEEKLQRFGISPDLI